MLPTTQTSEYLRTKQQALLV